MTQFRGVMTGIPTLVLTADARDDENMEHNGPEFVLIHAPYGRDAAMIREVLERADISAGIAGTIEEMCKEMEDEMGAALISDQSLTTSNVRQLADAISQQPPWSDFPLYCNHQWRRRDKRQHAAIKAA